MGVFCFSGFTTSAQNGAAVDVDDLLFDPRALVGHQVGDHARDVAGFAGSGAAGPADEGFQKVGVGARADFVGEDKTRGDGVRPDALATPA